MRRIVLVVALLVWSGCADGGADPEPMGSAGTGAAGTGAPFMWPAPETLPPCLPGEVGFAPCESDKQSDVTWNVCIYSDSFHRDACVAVGAPTSLGVMVCLDSSVKKCPL